ncbi:MAG: hypothetical protein MZV63_26390 [Marinilabiliales bacterium]|nr:hypothetical protein [Marinilabiliales bacterium]
MADTIIKYKDQLASFGKTLAKGIFSSFSGIIQIMVSLIIAGIFLAIGTAGESIRKFFRKVAGAKGDELADVTLMTVSSVVKGVLGLPLFWPCFTPFCLSLPVFLMPEYGPCSYLCCV